jgi:hypothetical protein
LFFNETGGKFCRKDLAQNSFEVKGSNERNAAIQEAGESMRNSEKNDGQGNAHPDSLERRSIR